MAAVFGVHLREAEHLAVGEFPADGDGNRVEIVDLVLSECESFALVKSRDIGDFDDRFGIVVDVEDLLVESMV